MPKIVIQKWYRRIMCVKGKVLKKLGNLKIMIGVIEMANAVFLNLYKLKKGVNVEDFKVVAKRLVDEEISKNKGFVSSTLMVDGDSWVDTIVFETKDDLVAFEEGAKKPSELANQFYSHINFMAKGNTLKRLLVVNHVDK